MREDTHPRVEGALDGGGPEMSGDYELSDYLDDIDGFEDDEWDECECDPEFGCTCSEYN